MGQGTTFALLLGALLVAGASAGKRRNSADIAPICTVIVHGLELARQLTVDQRLCKQLQLCV